MKTIQFIQDGHIERCRGRLFFLVTPDVNVVVVGSAIGESVDQLRIGVKSKNHRVVSGKKVVEVTIAQAVWMFRWWLQASS